MRMSPLSVPHTSGAPPPINTMTSCTHIVLGLHVNSRSQENLDHLEVAIVAGPDEGCRAFL